MWISDDLIIKDFVSIMFIKINLKTIIDIIAVINNHILQEIFINTIKGKIFCQLIRIKLLNQEIDFLNFKTQFCSGNIPILHIIEITTITLILGLIKDSIAILVDIRYVSSIIAGSV